MNTLLGQRIREQRKEKGWTIEQFAERVELSANYVGDLERGVKIPKLETFIRIVEVLDVSADVLIRDSVASASHVADDELCKKLSPYWQNTLRYITFPPFRGIRTHSGPFERHGQCSGAQQALFFNLGSAHIGGERLLDELLQRLRLLLFRDGAYDGVTHDIAVAVNHIGGGVGKNVCSKLSCLTI